MAYQGSDPTAGANKTPAPTTDAKHGGQGYGMAHNPVSPSATPDKPQPISELGANLRDSVDDKGALAHIQAHGVCNESNFQLRKVDDTLGLLAFGAKRQTAPSKVGDVVVGELPAAPGHAPVTPNKVTTVKVGTPSKDNAATNAAMSESAKPAGKLTAGQLVGSGVKLN